MRLYSVLFSSVVMASTALFATGSGHAESITYVLTGTFTGGGNGVFDPLGSSFSLTVTLPAAPAVTSSNIGSDFLITGPLDYELNGQPVSATQSFVEFINATGGGGIGFYLNDETSNYLVVRYFGDQLYSGDESSPTLLNVPLNANAQAVAVDNLSEAYFDIGDDNAQIGDAAPEPSTFWLPTVVICAIPILLKRSRRRV